MMLSTKYTLATEKNGKKAFDFFDESLLTSANVCTEKGL